MENQEIAIRVNYTLTKVFPWFWNDLGLENLSKNEKIDILKNYDKQSKYIKIHQWHNIVPSILRNTLATLISWTTVTPTFKANYCALWIDATATANTDIKLWNETKRFEFDNRYSVDNVAYLDLFLSKDQIWTGVYNEIWTFVDWEIGLNTWYLLSRKNINETFTGVEELSINISFTIS